MTVSVAETEALATSACSVVAFFFFQAEDGIRDLIVTGVQTCALPICDGDSVEGPPNAAPSTESPSQRRVQCRPVSTNSNLPEPGSPNSAIAVSPKPS